MPTSHTVVQGECLSSIAHHYGFADWRRIYSDPANAAFRRRRPNPDLIYPGDVLTIPDREPKTVTLETGKRHVIKVKRPPVVLRILLEVDEPHAYELIVGEKTTVGQTDGKSPIEQPISATESEAKLAVWLALGDRGEAVTWTLAIGHLDPIEELSGVQGRLANLGYFCGASDGQVSAELDSALARFRHDEHLGEGSDLDDATRSRLRRRHDNL